MVRRMYTEEDIRRGREIISQLDNALKVALREQDVLGKTMEECGAANAALGQELRRVFSEVSKKTKITPQQLKVLRDNNEFQRLNHKLQRSVDEANAFRDELRKIKDEIGIREDARERAQKENAVLRRRLEVGLDTRAAEYLKRIRRDLVDTPSLDQLLAGLKKLDFQSIDNKQPGNEMAAIFNAIKPEGEADVQSNKAFSKQPEWFQELYKQIKNKILSLGEVQGLLDNADQTKRELAKLIDTIEADIKSLERVPTSGTSLSGGKTKNKGTRRRKFSITKRQRRKRNLSQKHHKKAAKTRKNNKK
jgi:uncharacterized membrane protein YfbV (UPF0208 family)